MTNTTAPTSAAAAIETMRALRKLMFSRCESFDTIQLNRTPAGFNAPLAWHLAHVAVTTTLLTHGRAGCAMAFEQHVVNTFRKGTTHAHMQRPYELAELQAMNDHVLAQLSDDIAEDRLAQYDYYETSAAVPLATIDQACAFLTAHDGMHVGYILALARVIAPPH